MKQIALAIAAVATMALYSPAYAGSINTGGGFGVRVGKTTFEHSAGGMLSNKRAGFETKTTFSDGGKVEFGHSRVLTIKR